MNIIAVIPARMSSTRFPGKPMALIHDIPMIGHVFFRTKKCSLISETYVATCDQEIIDYIEGIGGKAVMTLDTHERCTDRTAEAMLIIEENTGKKVDIVVMIQGDEPMTTPEMIEQSLKPMLNNSEIQVVNLMAKIKTEQEFEDPNEVKVVVGLDGNAIYFSREPIPSRKKGYTKVPMLKQVCVIPFRRDFIFKFNEMPETPLERIESVDMMRVIEHGDKVKMVMTETETSSVDTQEDLDKVVELMKQDSLLEAYGKNLSIKHKNH